MKLRMAKQRLVLLPGMDGTGELFEPFLNVLPGSCEPTVVSYPTDRALTYQQLLPLIRERIPWGDPYLLVAESFSGPLALMFATHQRQDIQGIVLVASFVRNPLPSFLKWTPGLVNELLQSKGELLFRKRPPLSFVRKFLAGDDCPEILMDKILETLASVDPKVMSHRLQMALNVDATGALRDWERPLLYLGGADDAVVGDRGWKQVLSEKAEAVRVEIDAPHLVLQRRPREAWKAMEESFWGGEGRSRFVTL